jgi:hypothetical protein
MYKVINNYRLWSEIANDQEKKLKKKSANKLSVLVCLTRLGLAFAQGKPTFLFLITNCADLLLQALTVSEIWENL